MPGFFMLHDCQTMNEKNKRAIRSFVLRGGRMTTAQQHALDELWPHYGIQKGKARLEYDDYFNRPADVIVEIGFGNGESTRRMAQQEPQNNFIGIEVHGPGVGQLLMALDANDIENVRIAREDAVPFLQRRIPAGSLAGVRIYFPDPWPKTRHHKRRLIQPEFIRQVASCMASDAILHLATDWQPYAEHMLEVLKSSPDFINLSPDGDYCARPQWRPHTRYEQRGERLGHKVRDLLYKKLA